MSMATADTRSFHPPICFKRSFTYDRLAPTLVCDSVSGLSEIVRWALDLNLVVYREVAHSPPFAVAATNAWTGNSGSESMPVLASTDALVYTAESILRRLDQPLAPDRRLFPAESPGLDEVNRLFRLFTETLSKNVMGYVYTLLMPHRGDAVALLTQRAAFSEKVQCRLAFGSVKKAVLEQWNPNGKPAIAFLGCIQDIFEQVNQILSDGRRYLTGDKLTAADLAFASVGAGVVLPEEYGGAMPQFNQIPLELRNQVIKLRATVAGQFILRLYQDDRPINLRWVVPKEPGLFERFLSRLKTAASRQQYRVFHFLQRRFPVVNVWFIKITAIARHDLVVQALNRNEDFTIHEINARKMADQKGAFFLGMDRSNPQFDRERNFVLAVTNKADVQPIRNFFRTQSEEITRAVQPFGKLDVANTLCYVVLNRLLDDYFGVPAPTNSTMQRWCLDLFYDLFFNFTGSKTIHANAVNAANERNAWTMLLIKERKQALKEGKELPDNLLNRLILLAQQPGYEWVSDMTICRNIGGLLTGAFGTTNKAVVFVLDQLFQRPDQLAGAIAAAAAFDADRVAGYASEALRFSPVQPGVLRYSENEQYLEGQDGRRFRAKERRTVVALTAGAMFDPAAFPDPLTFNPARNARYMNWGFALHECYGGFINAISIPELVLAVLRLKNVRRAPGRAGQATGLNQGPFPNFFVVEFDPGSAPGTS